MNEEEKSVWVGGVSSQAFHSKLLHVILVNFIIYELWLLSQIHYDVTFLNLLFFIFYKFYENRFIILH